MRFQIADMQRIACQDKLETQEMLRAILDRLPPASGLSAPPARDVFVMFWLYFSHPFALHLYFLYPHTVGSANFEFGGIICAHLVFDYAFYFNYDLFSFVEFGHTSFGSLNAVGYPVGK
jgi:hypothetical protein